MMKAHLERPSKRLRSNIARGLASRNAVDTRGGDQEAGIIRGMAIITRGEALGHFGWIDAVFLRQVHDAIKSHPNGIKARFTHPGLSGDGLGKYTGRVVNPSIDGDVVRGDLHFSPTAHETPDGDLARYLMDLAADDPEAFGNSIAFDFDGDAERDFEQQHGGGEQEDEKGNRYWGNFESPDPRNVSNLPHFRLGKLHAVDAVDDPAANPSGLFHRGDQVALEAEKLAAYALGLSTDAPALVALETADPDRVRGFIQRFLARHALALTDSEGKAMPNLDPFAQRGRQIRAERATRRRAQLAAEKCMDDEEDEKTEELDGTAEKESTDKQIEESEQAEGDADKQVGDDKDTDSRQHSAVPAATLAVGGEATGGSSAADEGSRQDEYQKDQEEEEEKGKKNAEEATPVGSPSSEKKKGIGPMGDSSSNVPGQVSRAAEGEKFLKAFGDAGGVWFAQGKTFEEARELYVAQLKSDNGRLAKENDELHKKLTGRRGEARPLAANSPQTADAKASRLGKQLDPGMARFAAGLFPNKN